MTLLVLGGIGEAKQLTRQLIQANISVIYSIAGLVRQPKLECPVVSGGYSQFGGMAKFINTHKISAIMDVTHPYAVKISQTARDVAIKQAIPYWRYQRPPWLQEPEDRWSSFADWPSLLTAVQNKSRLFITAGQVDLKLLTTMAENHQQVFVRTAVKPDYELPVNVYWFVDVGPFSTQSERKLIEHYAINALITKNSGGEATRGKILAARELGLEVFLLQRPQQPEADQVFDSMEASRAFILRNFHSNSDLS